jgi:cell division protein FtsQ
MRHLMDKLLGTAKPAGAGRSAGPLAARRLRRRGMARWLRPVGIAGVVTLSMAAVGGGAWWVSRTGWGQNASAAMTERLLALSTGFGLAVADIQVEGRSYTAREAILRALEAERGTPILAVDPAAAKARLEALPWIRSASVERRLPDTLYVRLVERRPLALWQKHGKLYLIDRDGVIVTDERLDRFPGLPMVVGEDAPQYAGTLVDMLATEPDLASRVTAAVRVGGRRWNLVLGNGIEVQLPEENPDEAWAQLARMEKSARILARDVQNIDLRLPDRTVVRVNPESTAKDPKDTSKKGRPAAKST